MTNVPAAMGLPRSAAELHEVLRTAVEAHRTGRLEEAATLYSRVLARVPAHAEAQMMLGTLRLQSGKPEEAIALLQASLGADRTQSGAWINLATAFNGLRRHAEALSAAEAAIALAPSSPEAHNVRGLALAGLFRPADAVRCYDRAIALRPAYAKAHYNRGVVLGTLGRTEECVASYSRAIALNPDFVEAHHNLGNALEALQRHEEALGCRTQALRLKPGSPYILSSWINAKMQQCDWDGWEPAYRRFVGMLSSEPVTANFSVLLAGPTTPAQQLQCARTYVRSQVGRVQVPAPSLRPGASRRDAPLRVAYLSSDFRDHPMAYLTAELFERHDRSRLEVIGVSHGPAETHPMRSRLIAAFDRFVDVGGLPDPEIARAVRELDVDIAVDLNGFTLGSRLAVFAARPAPIQVSYMGHAGTTGADFLDYVIADRHVVPEEDRPFYSERVVYLPHTYWVNSRQTVSETPLTRARCGLPDAGFVFCCFNNPYKITPDAFDVWARLLRAVPGSVLWLYAPRERIAENLRAAAALRNIDPRRVVCAGKASHAEHLARHSLADLVLDTFYYNAHTTAADALWMGVPLVTRQGNTFAGRVAASLLHAIGLPELITRSHAEYEALALQLSQDPFLLARIKEKLVANRSSHPLFDTGSFARHLEEAYLQMWQRHRAGLPPDHIEVRARDTAPC